MRVDHFRSTLFFIRHPVQILLLLLAFACAACNSVVEISAQYPRTKPDKPTYRRVGVYFPQNAAPQLLNAYISGSPAGIGKVEIHVDPATRGTIMNALEASSAKVIVYDTLIDLKTIQLHKLDAFFWPKYITLRSSLDREGTIFPSYTSYSGVTLRLMRIGGFRGTLDSIEINATGSYYAHGIGSSRTSIAKLGAESALRDLATRIVFALNKRE